MVLILQTLRPKRPYNLKVSKVTQKEALLTWDGGQGDIVLNGEMVVQEHYSPFFLSKLTSATDYTVKVVNSSGESNEVSFTTISETPLRMNYKDETGELAKFILPE